ncbi:MAG: hypothetical protein HZB13_06990 [Acidobacteria bacterium]|nr:hypothetical protein [Acidobacteriota bacterium]
MRLEKMLPLLVLLPLAGQTPSILVGGFAAETASFHTSSNGLPSDDVKLVTLDDAGRVTAVTAAGAVTLAGGKWVQSPAPSETAPGAPQRALSKDGRLAEARAEGLFLKSGNGPWTRLFPQAGSRSWAPVDVRGVAFDRRGRLWFASPQGVGCLDGKEWTLYTGADGLPYDDFTTVAAGEPGVVWFGTKIGAIRFDGKTWEYRQGPRWLPADQVRSIAVDASGGAWIATAKGLAFLERKPMTLSAKARYFEDEIDKRHRRTPYEYVHPVILKRPGDKSEWTQTDSDNDGLWTSMYGAGECYACAATKSDLACRRAQKAFEALRFLGEVTQGGSSPAPAGFVARSILPTSGPDPNIHATPERDRQTQQTRDRLWKIISPRWPTSADGKWFWKTDTSSDELDGHYFFYALYYDLVAKTGPEKQRVRQHVAALTDHLLAHNYQLYDHDGKPTRWSIFNPENLNHNRDWWQERGMNSLSILAYLKVAEHITGDARYAQASRYLIDKHGYGMNALIVKSHLGPGAGNQSDDEMIFMNFYSLIKYETDPDLRQKYLLSFHNHFQNEQPEMNPVFNFLYASVAIGQTFNDAYGAQNLSPSGEWLEDAVDTLKRLPLDRIDWGLRNSHRRDIIPLPPHVRERGERGVGYRVNGKVLPIDERYVGHWNHDPWRLDYNGVGRSLGDGAIYLLPYYMGLYHGFIKE